MSMSEPKPVAAGYDHEHAESGLEKRAATADGDASAQRIGRLASVPIEELVYHANAQRRSYGMPATRWFRFFDNDFGPADDPANPLSRAYRDDDATLASRRQERALDFEQDKADARRALRTASWGMMFYLITTDVIGPFNAPYAISTLGFAGGVMMYFTLGIAALYSSFILLNLYLRLDSDRYPIHTYGELVEVFFGRAGHYAVSIIQVVQIVIIAGSNNIASAQIMTQLTAPHGSLCFIVSIVIWTLIGLANSIPFRSLSKLSYVASANVFINLGIIFISMGFIAHSPPNYASAANTYGFTEPFAPIATSATGTGTLSNQVNGAMNAVFGWSGLMIFVEFMAEMRRPYQFVRSFTGAETLVAVCYVGYGCYVYAFQGQYTLPVAFQGVSRYTWQSVGNGLALWTYTMASVTYLNIAVKVVYWFLFEDLFRGPPLMSRMGFVYWTVLQCAAWALAFIVGTAIPQVQTIQALVGAACLLQFSYTLPPAMQLAFDVRADASRTDARFDPAAPPRAGRADAWSAGARWRRGLLTGKVAFKAFNAVYLLAALATCALGIWGSIETIIVTFKESAATSFGCSAPV